MEKMGGMLEQGQAQQLQAILRLHYPLVYEAWMDLSGRSVLEHVLCGYIMPSKPHTHQLSRDRPRT